jgi:hypothetical protein
VILLFRLVGAVHSSCCQVLPHLRSLLDSSRSVCLSFFYFRSASSCSLTRFPFCSSSWLTDPLGAAHQITLSEIAGGLSSFSLLSFSPFSFL